MIGYLDWYGRRIKLEPIYFPARRGSLKPLWLQEMAFFNRSLNHHPSLPPTIISNAAHPPVSEMIYKTRSPLPMSSWKSPAAAPKIRLHEGIIVLKKVSAYNSTDLWSHLVSKIMSGSEDAVIKCNCESLLLLLPESAWTRATLCY